MSIDVMIRQKGLFKQALPLRVILGNNLRISVLKSDEIIVYNSNHIGRGFSVTYHQQQKQKETALRLLTPTSVQELHDFYQCVGRIVNCWKCTLEVDGEVMDPAVFQRGLQEMCRFNENALHHITAEIIREEDKNLTLFSALWPLAIGQIEARLFEEGGVEAFGTWMHKKQSIDAYYAKPSFFAENGQVVGRYVITENTMSIFPLVGQVPFGMVDSRTNEPLECSCYQMYVYSSSKDEMMGSMEYEQFLQYIDHKKISRYDGCHVLIRPLRLAELKAILMSASAKNEFGGE